MNDSSNSSPTLCDTSFVVLIRAHNGASGVCVCVCVCVCVVSIWLGNCLSLTWTCVCTADDLLSTEDSCVRVCVSVYVRLFTCHLLCARMKLAGLDFFTEEMVRFFM